MNNLSNSFAQQYIPETALVLSKNNVRDDQPEFFVEVYPLGPDGCPLAGYPLSLSEASTLGRAFLSQQAGGRTFLLPQGLLTDNILYLSEQPEPTVIWWTKAQTETLYFQDHLGIPSGPTALPPLLWKAGREHLSIYALQKNQRPKPTTRLCKAPFFNVYASNEVCMGTVRIDTSSCDCLESFVVTWERYFFDSAFSHLLGESSPIDGNIVDCWSSLAGTNNPFPVRLLKPTQQTLQSLLS
ncbi:MAG: hypothetical protein P4L51_23755 [Puia sp.]|nr:hypothetical protein [Puia sp.]